MLLTPAVSAELPEVNEGDGDRGRSLIPPSQSFPPTTARHPNPKGLRSDISLFALTSSPLLSVSECVCECVHVCDVHVLHKTIEIYRDVPCSQWAQVNSVLDIYTRILY